MTKSKGIFNALNYIDYREYPKSKKDNAAPRSSRKSKAKGGGVGKVEAKDGRSQRDKSMTAPHFEDLDMKYN